MLADLHHLLDRRRSRRFLPGDARVAHATRTAAPKDRGSAGRDHARRDRRVRVRPDRAGDRARGQRRAQGERGARRRAPERRRDRRPRTVRAHLQRLPHAGARSSRSAASAPTWTSGSATTSRPRLGASRSSRTRSPKAARAASAICPRCCTRARKPKVSRRRPLRRPMTAGGVLGRSRAARHAPCVLAHAALTAQVRERGRFSQQSIRARGDHRLGSGGMADQPKTAEEVKAFVAGARHPLHPLLVHGHPGPAEVVLDQRGGAGRRVRGGDGLRRLVDHGLQRDRGVGHDRDARPEHVRGAAVAPGGAGRGAHVLRRDHA